MRLLLSRICSPGGGTDSYTASSRGNFDGANQSLTAFNVRCRRTGGLFVPRFVGHIPQYCTCDVKELSALSLGSVDEQRHMVWGLPADGTWRLNPVNVVWHLFGILLDRDFSGCAAQSSVFVLGAYDTSNRVQISVGKQSRSVVPYRSNGAGPGFDEKADNYLSRTSTIHLTLRLTL